MANTPQNGRTMWLLNALSTGMCRRSHLRYYPLQDDELLEEDLRRLEAFDYIVKRHLGLEVVRAKLTKRGAWTLSQWRLRQAKHIETEMALYVENE